MVCYYPSNGQRLLTAVINPAIFPVSNSSDVQMSHPETRSTVNRLESDLVLYNVNGLRKSGLHPARGIVEK